MALDLLGAAPWAVLTGGASWFGAWYTFRDRKRTQAAEAADRLEIHQDGLTFELLNAARADVQLARSEITALSDQVAALRALEVHFYHFQQSLEHLDVLLSATTPEERASAERAAKAFLTRMRRINDAKGTIRNEVQRAESAVSVAEATLNPEKQK